MKIIKLTQNKICQVDDEDFELLSQIKWHANKSRNTFYAKSSEYGPMHKFLLSPNNPKIQIDHIDGNGLNNQRSNLRLATNAENAANRGKTTRANLTSKYKGVYYNKKTKKYYASVKKHGKVVFSKSFLLEKDAAIAYNKAALKYHGDFAFLNKVNSEKEIISGVEEIINGVKNITNFAAIAAEKIYLQYINPNYDSYRK